MMNSEMAKEQATAIVLFDGVCNFCNASVNFLLRRDRDGVFRFAALQSDTGRKLLADAGLKRHDLDSMVLIEGGQVALKSTAALRAARRLPGLWPITGLLLVIPRGLRDWCYDAFAARRYRWFGKREACMIPTAEMRSRFLA
jgi:predicted DCC family thiol-disulfide oxidoreductase YuxK